ncbi:MAG: DUF4342 domain-containing protein [Actinomycetota bacterium]
MGEEEKTWTESFKVKGSELVERIDKLIREGNVRRIIVKRGDHTVVGFPLTAGVAAALFAPMLAAAGAVAALVTDCTIVVERHEPPMSKAKEKPKAKPAPKAKPKAKA